MTWQPIATAPKQDHHSVLVVADGAEILGHQMPPVVGEAFWFDGGWYWMAQEPDDPEREETPIRATLWQPLPPPPTDNGWKPTKAEAPEFKCSCGSNNVWYREINSDHGDTKYHCRNCDRKWIIEGADA